MTLDELREKVNNDLPIKPDSLEGSAIDNMKLYSEYLTMLAGLKIEFKKLSNALNETRLERYRYYTGRSENDVFEFVLSASEVKQFIQGDAEVNKAELRLELARTKIELIEETIKAIRDRGFTIKNIIDLRKLEAGY